MEDKSVTLKGAFTPEAVEAASREVERLQRDLDITNADHIALWIEANLIPDEPMSQCVSWFACRIAEAYERAATRPSPEPRQSEDRDQQVRRIMNANAEYMNGVDRGQVRFGYSAVVSMIDAAIAETEARHRSEAQATGLGALLIEARDLFRFYEDNHRTKVSGFEDMRDRAHTVDERDDAISKIMDTRDKADRNKAMADKIDAALEGAERHG